MRLKNLKVKDLSAAAIYAQPVYYDWDAHDGEWFVVYPGDVELDCYRRHDFIPVMNYYYPVPRIKNPEALADVLYRKSVPLTLVYFPYSESYALALTAGGTDLTWEINFGYVLAGYLPPFCLCDLPRHAGMSSKGWRRLVLSACRRTCQIVKRQAASRVHYLKAEHFFGKTKKSAEREVVAPGA